MDWSTVTGINTQYRGVTNSRKGGTDFKILNKFLKISQNRTRAAKSDFKLQVGVE